MPPNPMRCPKHDLMLDAGSAPECVSEVSGTRICEVDLTVSSARMLALGIIMQPVLVGSSGNTSLSEHHRDIHPWRNSDDLDDC